MAEYYYVELYYSPDRISLGRLIDDTSASLLASGCTFKKAVMPVTMDADTIKDGKFVTRGLDGLGAEADAYAESMIRDGRAMIGFPPRWGRIMFEYEFAFDDHLADEVWEEEQETRASARDVGLSFMYMPGREMGRKIKLNLCFWEDFVLTRNDAETAVLNMRRIAAMVSALYERTKPYFGVLNNEMHLNTDSSFERLTKGRLPSGNDFALVGSSHIDGLNFDELDRAELPVREFSDGGVLIQFTDRFGESWVF